MEIIRSIFEMILAFLFGVAVGLIWEYTSENKRRKEYGKSRR